MFRNYLKIALRNLRKEKGFAAINIFGLAVGLATCLLITLYVVDELGYDRYNEKADRIYRVNTDIKFNGNNFNSTNTSAPMGVALAKDYPQIEKTVRLLNSSDMLVKKGNETIMEHHAVFADSTFFEIFSLPLLAGDPKTALVQPNTMVISESIARKYFGSTDVIGKTLLTANITNYKITGVMKDMPAQSHFHFNFIKAFSELEYSRNTEWLNNNVYTYVLARPGTDQKMIDHYIAQTIKKYLAPQYQSLLHSTVEDLEKSGGYLHYPTMPLARIHLYSHISDEFEANGNIQYVYIFMMIAVFILLIACVNFMNLSTARGAGRSKEVGVRKVLGSLRTNLISQFLTESLLTSFIAMLLALGIAMLLLPYFNQLAGKQISPQIFAHPYMIASLLAATLVVGLLAGSYPSFYLASFQPIQVLKGKLTAGFKNGWLRNSLVVFQFATAILLIIGTLVIYSQLNYIRNKQLGYDRTQVMTLQNTYSLWIHAKPFIEEVRQLPGVENATMTRFLPNSSASSNNTYFKDASMNISASILMNALQIDESYIPTLGITLAKGRNFSPQFPTDSTGILINETAAAMLGFKDPINQTLFLPNGNKSPIPVHILGVVKDFHAGSLHDKIGAMVMHLGEERGAISFRLNTKNIPALIAQIETKYHAVEKMAGQPFIYSFMDDDFNKLYSADQRTGSIFMTFAIFAIFIACLGLFGLVTYAAEMRTREIGIRKVLGATISNIVGLLSKDFMILVILAALIAFPIAWWGMHRWLQDFAYRTDISWWIFALAGLSAIAITLLTVSFRAIKAALANPVKNLRSD